MLHILVVDDEEDLLDSIGSSFAKDFPESTIETALVLNHGMALIKKAVENRWPYDLAVLDFKLPKDLGDEIEVDESLCQEISKYMKNTLVMITIEISLCLTLRKPKIWAVNCL